LKIVLDTPIANKIFKKAKLTCNLNNKGTSDSEFNFFSRNELLHIQSINDYCQQVINTEVKVDDSFEAFSCEANLTTDFTNMYSGDKLNIIYNQENSVVNLGDKSSKCVVLANDGSDFIPFNFVPKPINFDISGRLLWYALNFTAFSTSKESTINAVSLNFDSGYLTAYSFDDRRISRYKIKVGENCPDFESYLIPKETADILLNLLEDCETSVFVGQRHLRLSWTNTMITMSLVQIDKKSYPNLNKFFQLDDIASFEVSKDELIKSVKFAGLVAKNSFLSITLANKQLVITGVDLERGTTQVKLDTTKSENSGTVQVLYKDLMDVINKIDDTIITCTIKQISEDNLALCVNYNKFNHLLLPIVSKDNEEETAE
jgi:DNA polymerase III sliding clamp (beta) subunit (PCNA family)